MSNSGESVLTFGLIVLVMTFLDNCCQGQSPTCNSNSRPHPRGLCGQRLARAHRNLCFLLRKEYPDLFQDKRSDPALESSYPLKRTNDPAIVDKIYSIPLEVLADLDLTSMDKLEHYLYSPSGLVYDFPAPSVPEATPNEWENDEEKKEKFVKVTNLMLEILKDSQRPRRNALNSNMVCECCYNHCHPRQLGAYC